MNQTELEKQFEDLVSKIRTTLVKKGNDYSNKDRLSNFKQVATIMNTYPAQTCLTLMAIKISRLSNLLGTGNSPNFESVEDTALDLAVYSMLNYFILTEHAE